MPKKEKAQLLKKTIFNESRYLGRQHVTGEEEDAKKLSFGNGL